MTLQNSEKKSESYAEKSCKSNQNSKSGSQNTSQKAETARDMLKSLKVGEEKRFPRSLYSRLNGAKTALYCHGYNYIITSKKAWDYLLVIRLE